MYWNKCNSNKKWNNDKCWCKCKNLKKTYIFVAIWSCENRKNLASIIEDPVITFDEIIKEKTVPKTFTVTLSHKW